MTREYWCFVRLLYLLKCKFSFGIMVIRKFVLTVENILDLSVNDLILALFLMGSNRKFY